MVHDDGPSGLGVVEVVFDDERVVSDAGLVLCATLAARLELGALAAGCVDLGRRVGAGNVARKVLSLVMAMLAGADSIDDCQVLRAGRTGRLLGFRPSAPSTLGTFLRAFTFGHVRQLDRLLGLALERAWALGAGPGEGRLVVDVDSFIGPVHGYAKEGAVFGHTRQRGFHPILATRADSGEVLHLRLRKGSANTQRGIDRFVDELIARVRRAGARGVCLLRADSGFHSQATFAKLDRAGWQFSIAVRMTQAIRAAIEAIDEDAWTELDDYPDTGIAQIAETTAGGRRIVVRRVRTENPDTQLFATWRHFPIATNRTCPLAVVEAEHRQHAVIEQVIRDLKAQALAHFPSGRFYANAAWTVIAALAHNLHRQTMLLGAPAEPIRAAQTVARQLLRLPGRLTRHARRWTLHLPARWPWRDAFTAALSRLRALPAPA
jgi:hypothetical protein